MTRKHFQAIADALSKAHAHGEDITWTVFYLAQACAEASPRFDRQRFVEACYAGRPAFEVVAEVVVAFPEDTSQERPTSITPNGTWPEYRR